VVCREEYPVVEQGIDQFDVAIHRVSSASYKCNVKWTITTMVLNSPYTKSKVSGGCDATEYATRLISFSAVAF
jgi:hypothetical protein